MKSILALVKAHRRQIYTLGILIGTALFLQQLWQGAQAVRHQTLRLDQPIYLVAAVGLTLAAYGLQMVAWAYIMRSLGVFIAPVAMLRGYIFSFLPRYIPGTVWGYLSRSEWLRANYNIAYTTSNHGSALEVVLIVFTAGVFCLGYYPWQISSGIARVFLVPGLLIIIGSAWYGFNMSTILLGRYLQKTLGQELPPFDLYPWFTVCLIYLVMWLCHGLSLNLLLFAFSTGYQGSLFETTFLTGLAWLVGFITLIVPSGLGVREFTLANLLATLAGLPLETASAIAIISRLLLYMAEITWLVAGLLSLLGRSKIVRDQEKPL